MYIEKGDEFAANVFDLQMTVIGTSFLDFVKISNRKYIINDDISLKFFPVLEGTPYCNNKGITKDLLKSISWLNNNSLTLLKDNFSKYDFTEHSLFLLKEHCNAIIQYCDIKSKDCSRIILEKLNMIDNMCTSVKYDANAGLGRFLNAQNSICDKGTFTNYEKALHEIKTKLEFHCWMKYVFPQMKGLGRSKESRYFGIKGREEAELYINHPILRQRLIEATQAILDSDKTVYEIFGNDVMKVRACMLLFASVSDIPEFKKLINKYCWK